MARTILVCGAMLLATTALAHAERICDIEKRVAKLNDGDPLTVTGRIAKAHGPNDFEVYSYDIADNCGAIYAGHDKPIQCRGAVTINGKFDAEESIGKFGDIAICVTSYRCQ